MIKIEEYIGTEITRNKASAAMFERLVKAAYGRTESVMVGHHIGFENNGDITTENEIPSADTLIFDHCIMSRMFGDKAIEVMVSCARVPADKRDAVVQSYMTAMDALQVANPDEYAMERADDDGMPSRDDATARLDEARLHATQIIEAMNRQPAIAVPFAILAPQQPYLMGEG